MAGETIKSRAVCLRIAPWSRTSHIVAWLTPTGVVNTVVKGAVRPKSAFLGQYDLGYTCQTVYYAREHGELRALRECTPLELRSELRTDLDALLLSDRFRRLSELLSPNGPDAAEWFDALEDALDTLCDNSAKSPESRMNPLAMLIDFEMSALRLAGLAPEISSEGGAFSLRGERRLPVSPDVARCLARPFAEKNPKVLLDAARAIGVFYAFHVENGVDGRRQLLSMILRKHS